jgi:5-methylcytosine-specific restriction protein A
VSQRRTNPDSGYVVPKLLPRGPEGRALCRQCQTEVPKGRKTFCGDACVDAWQVKTSPSHVRNLLFRRDQGICCLCSIPTVLIVSWRAYALKYLVLRYTYPAQCTPWPNGFSEAYNPFRDLTLWSPCFQNACEFLAQTEPYAPHANRKTAWDADHIVPVVEGGGECDLDNFRTLCLKCHKEQTKLLAARRAKGKRT